MAWGEKQKQEATSPTTPSRAEEASGNIETNQDNKLFSVFIDNIFLYVPPFYLGVLAGACS